MTHRTDKWFARILGAIRNHPGSTASELSKHITDKTHGPTSREIGKACIQLEQNGIIRSVKVSPRLPKKRYYLSEDGGDVQP